MYIGPGRTRTRAIALSLETPIPHWARAHADEGSLFVVEGEKAAPGPDARGRGEESGGTIVPGQVEPGYVWTRVS